MDDQREVKCPAETYGADLVSEVMIRIYPNQSACAASHGCERDQCALEGHWPEETGCGDEEDEPEPVRAAVRQVCSGSSWEFLGSD